MPDSSATNCSHNFQLLYTSVVEKINAILTCAEDSSLKTAVLRNVEEIRSWLPSEPSDFDPKNRLHSPALNALQTALAILTAIESLSNQKKYKVNATGVDSQFSMSHLFSGGHLLIEDNGAFLANLKKHTILFNRYSSHYKNEKIKEYIQRHQTEGNKTHIEVEALDAFNKGTPDFSTRAEVIFNELLVGTVTKNEKIYTWLQFEGHSHQPRTAYRNALVQLLDNFLKLFHYSIEKFQHHLDFVNYLWHGKKQNIGQYGNSIFTESNPINMKDMEPADEVGGLSLS